MFCNFTKSVAYITCKCEICCCIISMVIDNNFETNVSDKSFIEEQRFEAIIASLSSSNIGSPKIGVESFILMIEHILVSILFDLTRATLLSLRNTLTLL